MPTLVFGKIKDLHSTETNVRVIKHSDAMIEQFAASIQSVGLLQPPVVVARPGRKKGYAVLAGEGRRRALELLAQRDPEWADKDIPLLLVENSSKLTEASLAENYVRAQMCVAEVYRSFALIKSERPSASNEEIGAPFGFTAAQTARIMRLANLAPEILEAYMAGAIDDASAQAYAATEDRALQLQVFEQMQGKHSYDRGPRAIHAALNVGDHELTRRLRYVGFGAYQAAGGEFEVDLFSDDENMGRIKCPAILNELAAAKLAEDKARYLSLLFRGEQRASEDGDASIIQFAWADAPPRIKQYGCEQTDYECRLATKRGELRTDAAEAVARIEEQLAALIAEDGSTEDEPAVNRLTAEREALEDGRPILLPDTGQVVGVATVTEHGAFRVDLWFASRAEAGMNMPKGARSIAAGPSEPTPEEAERARYGLSKDGMQVQMLMFRDMIRDELFASAQAGSSLAMDWLLFTQARTILAGKPTYGDNVYYSGRDFGVLDAQHDGDGSSKLRELAEARNERAKWIGIKEVMAAKAWVSAADPVEGFALFRAADATEKNCAAALVAGHNLRATTGEMEDNRTPRMVRELANHIEQEPVFGAWRDDISMDESFFAMFSHKARLSLLEEWGLAKQAKALKAKESAAFCARIANIEGDDALSLGMDPEAAERAVAWMPDYFRTGPVEPLPVKAANDDTDEEPFAGDEEEPDADGEFDDGEGYQIAAE